MKTNIYKKILVGLFLLIGVQGYSQSYTESFDDITTIAAAGWVLDNNSVAGTQPTWFQGNTGVFAQQEGTGYAAANFQNTTGANTISNWMISPERVLHNGDIITFWSRTVDAPAFPDRMEVRMSLNGPSVNCGTIATDVGDFTTVLLDINPTLTVAGYPNVWTQYTITISGLGAPTSGRIAFRYFVTNGGPSGANSDYIGVDDFEFLTAPANDLCANAIPLSACGTSVTTGSTLATTADPEAIACGPTIGSTGVWYTVVGNGSNITADLCTADYDTRIHVYTGTCAGYVCVGGNEDFCGTGSSFTWPSVGGTTYTIFVEGNAAATGNFTLTLTTADGAAPVADLVSLPDVSSSCSVTLTAIPTATDNCNGTITATTSDPVSYNTVGTHVVTWVYTDLSGNSSTQTQNAIVLSDATPPVFACLNDTTVGNTTDSCGAIVNYTLSVTDNCSNNYFLTQTTTQNNLSGYIVSCNSSFNEWMRVFDLPALGITGSIDIDSVQVGVSEAASAGGTQPIAINFYTLSGPLAYANLTLIGSTPWTVNDRVYGGLGSPAGLVGVPTSINIPAGSTLVVGYSYGSMGDALYPGGNTDGQTALCYIATPACGANEPSDPTIFGFPGICLLMNVYGSEGNLSILQTAGLPSGSVFPTGTTTNTFIADDGNGNTSTCSFDVTVDDTQAPIPDMDSCCVASNFTTGPIADPIFDNSTVTTNLVVSGVPSNLQSGSITSVCIDITHTWDSDMIIRLISPLGTSYELSSNNGGSANNYTQTCFDMAATTNITFGVAPFTGSYIPEGAGGFDVFNGEDPNGTWMLSVQDQAAGDQGTINSFEINFSSHLSTLLPQATTECDAIAPTGVDNCDGAVTATSTDPTSFTADGTYSIDWDYSDVAGNVFTQTQVVIVDDVTAPVPDVASLPIVTNQCTATVGSIPTATDNCMGTITATTTDPLTYNASGTYTITWTYDDGRGNIATQTQTVIVTDITPPVPVVTLLPNVVGNCVVTIDNIPTATDNCVGTITATTMDPLSYNLIGTFFIIWHYDDGNGNTWTQNQTVVVNPCLGIEDESGQWNALIYPNPSSGIFTLSLSQMPTENTQVRLVDALGQVLYSEMIQGQVQQFDFSGLASATYYLLITNDNGQISKPVIIRHDY